MTLLVRTTTVIGVAWALLGSACWSAAQQSRFPSEEFWKDPVFVKKFIGSYGFNTGIEPKITVEELKVLQTIVELMNDPVAAINTLRAAIKPDSSAALDFTLGNFHYQTGNIDLAAQNYRVAISKFPSFMRAHKNLGIVYVQKGDFKLANEHFTIVVELGGEDGNTYGLMGYCYLAQEKYISAETAYRNALMFSPDSVDWKLGLARCILAQQRSREAVALFDELIKQDPNRADYWLHQANAFVDLGEPLKAANNYEIVRRMGKATGLSLMALGDIYMMQEAKELALDAYLASLEKDPRQDINRPLRAAEILVNRLAWQEAAAFLKKITATYKDKMEDAAQLKILRLEAQVALASGDDKKAVDTLNKVIERDPLDGEALILLGNYYARHDQRERAELLYDRAAKIKGFEANALIEHAQMLVAEAKYDKAAKLLQRAQEIRPRDVVARYLEQVERLARATRP